MGKARGILFFLRKDKPWEKGINDVPNLLTNRLLRESFSQMFKKVSATFCGG
jgi:hypothetical protein